MDNINNLPKLNLPEFKFKFRKNEDDKLEIYDKFRNKYLILSPEEWVRQNFAEYLVICKGYPRSRIRLEKSIMIAENKRRCDIVYYNKKLEPEIIVECKSIDVKINHLVYSQIAMYNSLLKVKYMIVTNGINHFVTYIDYINKKFEFLNHIPDNK
ncbi:MAG: type I restriction enzyme HsdR N-terminal domain-containing protein [Candidatus Kapaibacterium sp.]|jgi:hypothetical protein|nr:type I restriction enzyme HsdR N-terminal domain-containing protein [Candidatus Kapabacteria bacterium]